MSIRGPPRERVVIHRKRRGANRSLSYVIEAALNLSHEKTTAQEGGAAGNE